MVKPQMPAFYVLLFSALCLSGCLSGLEIRKDYDHLNTQIGFLDEDFGRQCAPESLALAEAHRQAAEYNMRIGDAIAAQNHVQEGLHQVGLANVESESCRERLRNPVVKEKAPSDADGDGIVDEKDQCPDQAEDFDGNLDEDGCPELDDSDGDGIADDMDRCPNQPEDIDGDQDQDGCPDITDDRDADGLADAVDQCPDQPEDLDTFQDQDGCPDVDNDSDGIFDVVDRCPLEAEDLDAFEDADGCPDLDNDRDGLADRADQCPNEAETMNGFEDDDGCPDTRVEMPQTVYIENQQIKIRDQIHFETGKAIIKSESFGILNDLSKVLIDNEAIKIRIEGHTDSQGSELYNLNLSKKRAAAVLHYLKKQGVSESRMRSIGLGESSPIDDNASAEGRANNRRVEFHITEQ